MDWPTHTTNQRKICYQKKKKSLLYASCNLRKAIKLRKRYIYDKTVCIRVLIIISQGFELPKILGSTWDRKYQEQKNCNSEQSSWHAVW